MTSYFSALVDFVHAHSQYTHIAIFLLALSEAIPVGADTYSAARSSEFLDDIAVVRAQFLGRIKAMGLRHGIRTRTVLMFRK
jgi:hypothetical protein